MIRNSIEQKGKLHRRKSHSVPDETNTGSAGCISRLISHMEKIDSKIFLARMEAGCGAQLTYKAGSAEKLKGGYAVMKLVFIIGDAAVGKMTVGQELMSMTKLRLFHNHMTIEPVIEIFGRYDGKTIAEMRDLIFRNFAASENEGMIFTMMMDFDMPSEWEYLEHIKGIFEPYGTEFYYVELIAPQEIRLKRNVSENRLKHKASKRDIESSNQRLINDDRNHRCVSYEGEITFDNYLRIENSDMAPVDAARLIKETFHL